MTSLPTEDQRSTQPRTQALDRRAREGRRRERRSYRPATPQARRPLGTPGGRRQGSEAGPREKQRHRSSS